MLADEETFLHLRMGSNTLTRPLSRELPKTLATTLSPAAKSLGMPGTALTTH